MEQAGVVMRVVQELSGRRFDVVVLGGGILGACVARDCAMRGLQTALVDASDFGAATSANSLKVVHGGIRHLQHGDLAELRSSARERATWLRIAPHLVRPLPVVIPLVGSPLEPLMYRTALAINDVLTPGRNRDLVAGQEIPDGRLLSKQECLDHVPGLDASAVHGGVLYYDAQMYSSERLVLAVVQSAVEAGAVAVNHAECTGPLLEAGRRVGVSLLDRLDGSTHDLRARVVVNAAGPGAAKLHARLFGKPTPRPIRFSLAWNLVLDSVGLDVACALPGEDATPTGKGGERARRLFVVPWRGRTLVGTGHAVHDGEPGEFTGMGPDHPAMSGFLGELNAAWFGDEVRAEDVLMIQSGLLPAYAGGGNDVRLMRRHTLTASDSGGAPVLTATTVKFTAARRLAEYTTDRACRILGHRAACRTATTPLTGAPPRGMDDLLSKSRERFGSVVDDDVLVHLAHSYGTGLAGVLTGATPEHLGRVSPDEPVLEAQWVHAIREEMACTVDDLLFRRTELGARGLVDPGIRERASRLLAGEAAGVRR